MIKTKRKFNIGTIFFSQRKKRFCRWPRRQECASYPFSFHRRNKTAGSSNVAGSINLGVAIIFFAALSGIAYIHSINSSAVKGVEMRQAEKEVVKLKKENEQLIIKEAELKSLYNIEEASKKFNMDKMKDMRYVNESSPMALR